MVDFAHPPMYTAIARDTICGVDHTFVLRSRREIDIWPSRAFYHLSNLRAVVMANIGCESISYTLSGAQEFCDALSAAMNSKEQACDEAVEPRVSIHLAAYKFFYPFKPLRRFARPRQLDDTYG